MQVGLAFGLFRSFSVERGQFGGDLWRILSLGTYFYLPATGAHERKEICKITDHAYLPAPEMKEFLIIINYGQNKLVVMASSFPTFHFYGFMKVLFTTMALRSSLTLTVWISSKFEPEIANKTKGIIKK